MAVCKFDGARYQSTYKYAGPQHRLAPGRFGSVTWLYVCTYYIIYKCMCCVCVCVYIRYVRFQEIERAQRKLASETLRWIVALLFYLLANNT